MTIVLGLSVFASAQIQQPRIMMFNSINANYKKMSTEQINFEISQNETLKTKSNLLIKLAKDRTIKVLCHRLSLLARQEVVLYNVIGQNPSHLNLLNPNDISNIIDVNSDKLVRPVHIYFTNRDQLIDILVKNIKLYTTSNDFSYEDDSNSENGDILQSAI